MFLTSLFTPKADLYFVSTENEGRAFAAILSRPGPHREAFEESFGAKARLSKTKALRITHHPDRREHILVGYKHLCDAFKEAGSIDPHQIRDTGITIQYVDMVWAHRGLRQEDSRTLGEKWAAHVSWKKEFDRHAAEAMVDSLPDFLAHQEAKKAARETPKPRIQKFFENLFK